MLGQLQECCVNVQLHLGLSGGLLCFSHRTLHWGSKAVRGSPARIAMSFAFADPAFEEPFFDPALYLPLPPVRLRAALQVSGPSPRTTNIFVGPTGTHCDLLIYRCVAGWAGDYVLESNAAVEGCPGFEFAHF